MGQKHRLTGKRKGDRWSGGIAGPPVFLYKTDLQSIVITLHIMPISRVDPLDLVAAKCGDTFEKHMPDHAAVAEMVRNDGVHNVWKSAKIMPVPIFPMERQPNRLTRLASDDVEYWIREPPATSSKKNWVRLSMERANYAVYLFTFKEPVTECAGVPSERVEVAEVGDVLYMKLMTGKLSMQTTPTSLSYLKMCLSMWSSSNGDVHFTVLCCRFLVAPQHTRCLSDRASY